VSDSETGEVREYETLDDFLEGCFEDFDLETFVFLESYFERPGYYEFRIGDYQHELGLIDSRYAPTSSATGPGVAILYWHVDHVAATLEKLLSMGAKEYEALTRRGEAGFVTASW
jgi:hypothetical protein